MTLESFRWEGLERILRIWSKEAATCSVLTLFGKHAFGIVLQMNMNKNLVLSFEDNGQNTG